MSKWFTLKSTNLHRCRYFRKSRLLLIEFHSGDIYVYGGIDWPIYMKFRRAQSHGTYHAQVIKRHRDKYPCTKLSPTDVTHLDLR